MSVEARYAAAYGAAAEGYLTLLDPTLATVHRRLADLAGAGRGCRVLDLATGTGAAARVANGLGAEVVGVDISTGMVELARRNSPPGITFEVADAAALPFPAASFDAVICGFGLSHMPDATAVLKEARRVLAPAGRLVESSWGAEGEGDAFAAVLAELKARSQKGIHSFAGILDEDTWAAPDRGRALIEAAGFADVRVLTERLEGSFRDPRQAVEWTLAWPDYGEVADGLGEGRAQFLMEATAALASKPLDWWFAINYYVGQGIR